MKRLGLDSTVKAVDRRRFLVGGTGALMALPFLESLVMARPAYAWQPREGGPKRLFVMYQNHGTIMDNWVPGENFELGSTLRPVADAGLADQLLVVDGIANKVREGHDGNEWGCLTCRPALSTGPDKFDLTGGGRSFDHEIALALVDGGQARRMDVCVDRLNRNRQSNLSFTSARNPVAYLGDPNDVFTSLFPGGVDTPPITEPTVNIPNSRRKSVLDAVLPQFNRLRQRVSAADRERLDLHAEKLQAIEAGLALMNEPGPPPPTSCRAFTYDSSPGNMDQVARAHADVIAYSLACNAIDVATMKFMDVERLYGGATEPPGGPAGAWDFLGVPHMADVYAANNNRYHTLWHAYADQHDRGDAYSALAAIADWRGRIWTRVMQNLASYPDEGGGSALDHTMMIWIAEFGQGQGHSAENLPVAIGGNAGDVALGRHVSLGGRSPLNGHGRATDPGVHNLAVTTLNAFNINVEEWGSYSGLSNPVELGPLEL